MRVMFRFTMILCVAAFYAGAQDQIEGVNLSLRLTQAGPFREGELIPIEVEFRHPSAPADERPETIYQFAGVLLDPRPDCGDIAHPCWNTHTLTFMRNNDILNLNDRVGPFPTDLNLYIPRLKPGKYTASLLAQALVLKPIPPWSASYVYPDPRRYVVSNAVTFEIQPATAEWIGKSIKDARAILSKPPALNDYPERQHAARVLSFVQGQDAWEASLDNGVFEGLIEADDQKAVCKLMQKRVEDPGVAVSTQYLQTMGQICEGVEFPQVQFDQNRAEGKEQAREWAQKTSEFRSALFDRAADTLAATLEARKSASRDAAIRTLIDRATSISNNEPAHPGPAWLPHLHRYLVLNFSNFETRMQCSLLGGYWQFVRGSEMFPSIENILDRPATDYANLDRWRLAIQRLCDLDEAKCRARLLEEMQSPDTRLDERVLALLPPADAPPMDSVLIGALINAQSRFGGGNPRMTMTIIARYAPPAALPRIKEIYESQRDPCQPELMAYFLRVDPGYADRIFHEHPWDMLQPPPACITSYFEITSAIYMHPALETYMSAYLMHGIVKVKRAAAVALGKYGSANAEAPLWGAFRYFHEYWKDHPHDLPSMGEGEMLENDLRNAIARGRNWVEDEASLRMMESLCITWRCQYETENDIRAWTPAIRIDVNSGGDFRASVAQYYGFESLAELENKLGQFPAGTHFQLQVWGPEREKASAELMRFGAVRGGVVQEAR